MKGINFIEELFRKVLIGEKTVTRRTGGLKEVNKYPNRWNPCYILENGKFCFRYYTRRKFIYVKPRYLKDDIVYLKEPCGRISGIMFYAYDYPEGHKMRTEFKGWANKLFMKAENARYKIRITDVRLERAHDITDEDCIKEGLPNKAAFESCWMRINGISSWKQNPYVFRYEFERI